MQIVNASAEFGPLSTTAQEVDNPVDIIAENVRALFTTKKAYTEHDDKKSSE